MSISGTGFVVSMSRLLLVIDVSVASTIVCRNGLFVSLSILLTVNASVSLVGTRAVFLVGVLRPVLVGLYFRW